MGIKRSRRDSASSSEDSSTPYSREQSVDVKIVHLDTRSAISETPAVMRCSLPPHQPLSFDSFEAYDVHYQKTHMNRCSECQKNFPDEHFLNLHIAENHDPISAAKRDQGERTQAPFSDTFCNGGECQIWYACLLPDCDRLCSTPQKRRLHCVDKHLFPHNYDFFIVNDGIDRRSSMLRPPHRRRSSAFSSMGESGAGTRRRDESFASTAGDGMDVVKDESDEREEIKERRVHDEETGREARRAPVKLRGRGGFSHPGALGRGRGRGALTLPEMSKSTSTPSSTHADSMDNLAASMSALQFIPHSVRTARGRGRASGRG